MSKLDNLLERQNQLLGEIFLLLINHDFVDAKETLDDLILIQHLINIQEKQMTLPEIE